MLFLVRLPAAYAQQSGAPDGSAQVSENSAIVQSPALGSEEQYPIASAVDGTVGQRRGSAWVYVRMVLVLAVIVAIIWLLARFFKKNMNGGVDENPFMLRRVASISLGAGKSVQIVTLLDNDAYLLGITDNSVTLLGKIEDKELIQALNLNADKADNTQRPKSFAEVLDLFTQKKGGTANAGGQNSGGVYGSSTGGILDALKKQRDRLGGEDGNA